MPPRQSRGVSRFTLVGVLSLTGLPNSPVRISGKVWFYDARCAGVELVATTGDPTKSAETSLGTFSPAANDAKFDATLEAREGGPVFRDVRGTPENPEEIRFCTLILKSLAGRSLP